jgi:pyruvate,water dikinase
VEDDVRFSYAGIFSSFLQIKGVDSILDCVKAVWQSLDSTEFISYQNSNQGNLTPVKIGVIIQEMVPAVYSGIVFSRNPMTGLSETIIEVGQGTGEDQVIARKDPERWVDKWGSWIIQPENGLIPEELARNIVNKTKTVELKYGQPIDLEWAYDGKSLFFLQVRPITRLDIPVFSNRISREMLPGIIKPLVWSVNTRLINQIWVDILEKMTGDHSFQPETLTGHFYYRAYFNITVFGRVFERLGMPSEALELLFGLESDGPDKPHMRPGLGILARLPRLFSFAFSFFTIESRFNRLLEAKKQNYIALLDHMPVEPTISEWMDLLDKIFNETKPVVYFNIVIPMLAMMHHRLFTNMLKKYGYDARLLELKGVAEATEQTSPHSRLDKLHQKYFKDGAELTPENQLRLEMDLEKFLEEFGHFSDSGNDCSSIPWRETPDLIRQMVAQPMFESNTTQAKSNFEELNFPWFRRGFLRMLYHRTSRFAVHRETISSLYTYGYGLFRKCFIGLGTHLVSLDVLESSEDVFYLYWKELVELVNSPIKSTQKELVKQRKLDIELNREAVLPDTIFGFDQPPIQYEPSFSLKGIPTSLGTYTGPARILNSLSEFERLNKGDVLVIPYSDVGWTPLFARAGAVVAESGGILSHSSIVAREYRIPAVVSVSGACRIADGSIITVNGYSGDIIIENDSLET